MGSTLKDYNESGVKKAAVGVKVLTDEVAVDTAFDIPTQKYYGSAVYAVHASHYQIDL